RRCYHRDGEDDVDAGWNSLDQEGLVIADMLLGFDRRVIAASRGRRTAAMAVVAGGGDGASNPGAPA
ncbi:hypothetical protein ACLOJK_022980, partial [Asimina triloba]